MTGTDLQFELIRVTEERRKLANEVAELHIELARLRKRNSYFELFATDACKYCVDNAVRGVYGRV